MPEMSDKEKREWLLISAAQTLYCLIDIYDFGKRQ